MPTTRKRRLSITAVTLANLLGAAGLAAEADAGTAWPEWDRFADRFIQADGRVIDLTFDGKSTSEGQSYALFFALVANDRARFDAVLDWTSANLADKRLGEQLPGWLWGKHDDGHWAIKDRNAAADADLWLAYALLEAGRLWQVPKYDALGRELLELVGRHEVAHAGAAGTVLLPGPVGFVLSNDRFRINPSYLPGFMFEYFAAFDPNGPWAEIWRSYVRLAPEIYAAGVAPDEYVVSLGVVTGLERTGRQLRRDSRVMGPECQRGESNIVRLLAPFMSSSGSSARRRRSVPPPACHRRGFLAIGFVGAALPFLAALNEDELLRAHVARLAARRRAKLSATTHYYDQVLILFGRVARRAVSLRRPGRLQPKWLR
jgi:endoglucanase